MNGVRIPRRQWLKRMFSLGAAPVSVAMATVNSQERSTQAGQKISRLEKPRAEWRKLLTPEAYAVLFEERTEAPFTSPLDREAAGHVCMRGLLSPAFQLERQIRQRHGLAKLLRAAQGACGHEARLLAHPPKNRIPLHTLRWAPGSRVRRRAATHCTALVQQRRGAEVRAGGRSAAAPPDVS